MNIMFLLIPALLLAMEFASMASINVSPPKFTNNAGGHQAGGPEEGEAAQPQGVRHGGRLPGVGGRSARGGRGRQGPDSKAPTIPLAKPGAPLNDYDRYDYAALEERR
jgi:hypothetical protein